MLTGEKSVPLYHHPDIQRMLLTLRAQTFALRSLGMQIATRMDKAAAVEDPAQKNALGGFVGLMTPVFKAYATETANSQAGMCVQVFGGMGFVEEAGVAQYMRDIRIATIYEGTTGIQANDLLFRKVLMEGGQSLKAVLQEMRQDAETLRASNQFATEAGAFTGYIDAMEGALTKLLTERRDNVHGQLSGAVYFLELMGLLTSSWHMVKTLITADRKVAENDDEAYHADLCALARFYIAHISPRMLALVPMFENASTGIDSYRFGEE